MKIVQAAKETSNREQGRIHSLDESIIRRWRTNESKLIEAENLPKRMVNNASPMGKKFGNRCRSIGGGRKPKYQEIEQELLSWIDEKRAKALHVSRKMIKERALIIFEEKKAKESDHFSASDGWISNFGFYLSRLFYKTNFKKFFFVPVQAVCLRIYKGLV